MEEIDIKELLGLFWSRKIQIVIITVVVMILGAIYSYTMVKPKYEASTTLVLASASDNANETESITQTDITINSKLVATYSELVKSKTVLREVISNLELEEDLTENALRSSITVSSIKNTEIIKIVVQNPNSEIAAKLANEIARIFSIKVGEIYNINNVHIVDEAEITNNPCNVNHIRDLAIAAAIGIVIAFAEILLVKLLDNKIHTEQDIEKSTKLLVLGLLPKNEVLEDWKEA